MDFNSNIPKLEWPESSDSGNREDFYRALYQELGEFKWAVILLNPTPFDAVRKSIETDCHNLLHSIQLPKNGLAWSCERAQLLQVLPGVFQSLKPEIVVMAFNELPTVEIIVEALQGKHAFPAISIFIFDDGELVEIRMQIN